ncbi:MAG TPA: PQQ-binding-like beta-propeller repeat protein, partial [Ardenticatenaceae bacterium]|nr:PQQ-binding-like beta-propeller repeat protein [Ardenticatenaceae bacterium]
MTTQHADAAPTTPLWRDALALAALITVVVVVAAAFLWPWQSQGRSVGSDLARYAPVRNGDASLLVRYGPGGEIGGWQSQNLRLLAPNVAFTTLRAGTRDLIEEFYTSEGEELASPEELLARMAASQIVEGSLRDLAPTGATTDTTFIAIRESRGQFLVSWRSTTEDQELLFDPPLQLMPADLAPGSRWEGSGELQVVDAGSFDYTVTGQVLTVGPYAGERLNGDFPASQLQDCVEVETRLAYLQDGTSLTEQTSDEWYCAGLGVVSARTLDAEGHLTERLAVVAAPGIQPDPSLLPPPLPSAKANAEAQEIGSAPPESAGWELTRFGRTLPMGVTGESSVPPTLIPSDPPLLLGGSYGGGLVALNEGGTIQWRFVPDGTVFSAPAYDPERGRIYFGASDRRLYALDTRGLFLWSFQTGDNVASRPVIAGDLVIFGSEDRHIYAVDADTGVERWRVLTGAAVVSDPTLVRNAQGEAVLVAIGSDDGAVYGLDPHSGQRRWRYNTGRAVEAPIVEANGTLYAASRQGTLAALEPASGDLLWEARVGLGAEANPVRSAPAIGGGSVFVVAAGGSLRAFEQATGRHRWSKELADYSGPPIVVGESVFVARRDGIIHQFSFDGAQQGEWSGAEANAPGEIEPAFYLGLTAGGDAVWAADASATIYRLGPQNLPARAASLVPAWLLQFTDDPLDGELLYYAPLPYRDQALVLSTGNHIHLIDPDSGEGVRIGRFGGEEETAFTEPVVAGDMLVGVAGNTLYATEPSSGRELWSFHGAGSGLLPPSVTGDTVLWLAPQSNESGQAVAVLNALDLASGHLRWRAVLTDFHIAGAPVGDDRTAYVSTPPTAFDLASGRVLWSAEVEGGALGAPALNETGDTLYVGVVNADETAGALVAFNTSDGGIRWRSELGGEALNYHEQPWVAGDVVIVPTYSGKIIALSAADGAERWSFTPPESRLGGITVAAGRVWVALQTARLLVLGAGDGSVVAQFNALEF